MPDIQTALKEAIKDWGDSAGRHQVEKQQPTPLPEVTQMQTEYTPAPTQQHGDVLRAVFEFIKANPNSAVADIVASGIPQNTTSSAINRLYTSGRVLRKTYLEQRNSGHGPVMRNVYRYTTTVENAYDRAAFVPNPQAPKKIVLRKKQPAAQPVQGIAALPTEQQEIKPSQGILRIAPTPQPETASPIPANITAEYVMQHISLAEGKKLYTALHNVFGY